MTRSTPISVFLVDDQTLVRQGIRSLLALAEGIEVVAEASDGRQAVERIPEVKPDVVLMDMRMPAMSGLEALQAMAPCRHAAAHDHPHHLRRRPAGAGRDQGRRQGLPAQGRVAGAAGRTPSRPWPAVVRWCSRR